MTGYNVGFSSANPPPVPNIPSIYSPAPQSAPAKSFNPSDVFAQMKTGQLSSNGAGAGPQDPNKYNALRPDGMSSVSSNLCLVWWRERVKLISTSISHIREFSSRWDDGYAKQYICPTVHAVLSAWDDTATSTSTDWLRARWLRDATTDRNAHAKQYDVFQPTTTTATAAAALARILRMLSHEPFFLVRYFLL